MNRVYKIVWSRVKNCYVVVSELAKSRTKEPSSSRLGSILVVGMLISLLGCGFVVPVYAATANRVYHNVRYLPNYDITHVPDVTSSSGYVIDNVSIDNEALYNLVKNTVDATDNGYTALKENTIISYYIATDSSGNSKLYARCVRYRDLDEGDNNVDFSGYTVYISDADLASIGLSSAKAFSGATYTAGNGISISGDTISAKAGTNVTVNSNGISVTGNGSVASGNTGLIDGGKLYAEVRPSDNGNYVETSFAAV